MNGRPARSSGSPGTSPTNMISASGAPSPKTSLAFAPETAHNWHVAAWRDSISAKRAVRSSREPAGAKLVVATRVSRTPAGAATWTRAPAGAATTARISVGACTTSLTCTTARASAPPDESRDPCNGRGDTSRPSARSKRASTAWTVNGSGMNVSDDAHLRTEFPSQLAQEAERATAFAAPVQSLHAGGSSASESRCGSAACQ